ncbi:S1 family peptidase [Labilithrix luteola]|nr:trypsin-like serine protease [Labilithrix luteola]
MRALLATLLIPASIGVLAGACAAHDEDDATSDNGALIGGQVATTAQFPSNLYLKTGCTAAKVAPKKILTAAHCVFDPAMASVRFANGSTISVSRDPVNGFAEHKVKEVHVHPSWVTACEAQYCAASSVTALMDAADIALIELEDDIEYVPSAEIDTTELVPKTKVVIIGFGCTKGVLVRDDRPNPTLAYAIGEIAPPQLLDHPGSPIENDKEHEIAAGNYALTYGPASYRQQAGICPGDSGGPLYRDEDGKMKIVGVNSNYTFFPDQQDKLGLPVSNWHTRLDGNSRQHIAEWLQSLGALSNDSWTKGDGGAGAGKGADQAGTSDAGTSDAGAQGDAGH